MRYDTAAKKVASAGRHGDTELVHVSKDEIDLFNSISPIPLTTNPQTGAKEAFFFLPMLGGLLGSSLLGGTLGTTLGSAALGTAAAGAIGSGLGSLAQGDDPGTALMNAGMSGIGGYAMNGGLGSMGGLLGEAGGAPGVGTALANAPTQGLASNLPGGAAASGATTGLANAATQGVANSTSATGGIMGWIKDNPLLAAGGAALALPMLTGSGQTTAEPKTEKVKDGWKANPYTGGEPVFPGSGYRPGKDPEWDYYAPFKGGGLVRFAEGGNVGDGGRGGGAGNQTARLEALPRSFVPFDPKVPQQMLASGEKNPDYAEQMKAYKPPAPVMGGGAYSTDYMARYTMDQNARNASQGGLMPVFRALAQKTGMNNAFGDILSGGGLGSMSGFDPQNPDPSKLMGGNFMGQTLMPGGGLPPLGQLGVRGFAGGGPVMGAPGGIAALGQNIAEGIDNNAQAETQANGPMANIGRDLSQSLDPGDPVVIGVVKAIQGKGGDSKPAIKAFIQKYGAAPLERLMAIYGPGGIAERQSRQASDGMSDSVPAMINGQQPAALSEGEFVVPADAVSGIGNGSTDAGAKTLQQMVDRIRQARTGTAKQPAQADAMRMMPA